MHLRPQLALRVIRKTGLLMLCRTTKDRRLRGYLANAW